MAIRIVDDSQRSAARVAGIAYLLLNATGIFGEVFVRAKLVDYNDAAATARNIASHETLFRLGVVSELLTLAVVVVLIASLYVILKPVNRSLALIATIWRIVEVAMFAGLSLASLDVLRILSGASYLGAFRVDQLQALARLAIGTHPTGYTASFVFLGLGTGLFSYLWFKSNYIPKVLAGWGIFASAFMASSCLLLIAFPALGKALYPAYMLPMGIFEISMGFWLSIKGLNPSIGRDFG